MSPAMDLARMAASLPAPSRRGLRARVDNRDISHVIKIKNGQYTQAIPES
jgi:hypothetical protein